jgi:mannosyltransferase
VVSTAACAAAIVIRHLGTKPLWLDETVSVSVASRPLYRVLGVLPHHDANAGLYYLLLHVWLHFGHGAAWDRGPSAVCFVATAALAAWVGSRWRGPWLGLAWGLLVATNPFLLYYGQEARPYALAVLLTVASTAALFWRDERPDPRLYVGATIALIYADLFALLFVVAQAVAVVAVCRRRRVPLPPLLARCWTAIAAATAPLVLLMMLKERSQISWLSEPTFKYLQHTVTEMTAGWLGFTVVAGLTALAIHALLQPGPPLGPTTARDGLVVTALIASFAIPPLLLWLVAQIVPSFVDRYVICSTVAAIALAGLGIDVVRKRAGRVVAWTVFGLLVVLGGQRTAAVERAPLKGENPPAVVSFLQGQARPGDAIGFGGGGLRTVIDAYLPNDQGFPGDIALAPGGQAWLQHDVYAREVSSATLQSRLTGIDRLWLVTDPSDHRYPTYGPFSALRPDVSQAFQPATRASFPGIDVTLYVRRRATPRRP